LSCAGEPDGEIGQVFVHAAGRHMLDNRRLALARAS